MGVAGARRAPHLGVGTAARAQMDMPCAVWIATLAAATLSAATVRLLRPAIHGTLHNASTLLTRPPASARASVHVRSRGLKGVGTKSMDGVYVVHASMQK
eukprot:365478-Chlamydomonas_euryale.AAC.2